MNEQGGCLCLSKYINRGLISLNSLSVIQVRTVFIPSLFFIRESNVTGPRYKVYKPSLCIVVQGMKENFLAQERFRYGPADYLVTSVDLPVSGQVMEASSDVPYLALKLEFTPSQILEVLRDSAIGVDPK
jgi:hypothetical protein